MHVPPQCYKVRFASTLGVNIMLVSIRLLLLLVCFAASALAEDAQLQFVFEPEIKIPMRDGVPLAANVFRPKGDGPWPVILIRTPYGKGDEQWPGGKDYALKGYVTVVEDCRGRGTSEGVWEPFR